MFRIKQHLETHKNNCDSSTKRFPCLWPNCSKDCKTNYGLRNHMRIYTGERPQVCPFPKCNATIRQEGNLGKVNNHLIIY